MACGTPVVASNIPGNPEVVQAPAAGLIVAGQHAGRASPPRCARCSPPCRRATATRAYAERFGWEETSRGQLAVFRRVLAQAAEPQRQPRRRAGGRRRQPVERLAAVARLVL